MYLERLQLRAFRQFWLLGRGVMDFADNYYEVKTLVREESSIWPQ